jgi:rhodanese-related sulfurtransferase
LKFKLNVNFKPQTSNFKLKTMKHLEPKQAHEFLTQNPNAIFIDCRSEMEYLFVGHPVGSQHVAWNDGPDWDINPHFVGQVKKIAGANFDKRPIVLICRSGNRTIEEGEALERAGFKRVYNVLYGFEGELDEDHHRNSRNGWRVDGLPWEQY